MAQTQRLQASGGNRSALWIIGLCFFFSGATGLVYENIWFRLLGLLYGNTTLAVSAVVAAFMGGLALGSWLIGSRADALRRPLTVYGFLEIFIGVYCYFTPMILSAVQALYIKVIAPLDLDVGLLTPIQFAISAIVFIPPTIAMGATLPVLSAGLHRVLGSVQKTVGLLYAINTFGAVMGAFLAGFFLLWVLGVHLTIIVAAVVNCLVGCAAIGLGRIASHEAEAEEEAAKPEAAAPVENAPETTDPHERRLARFMVLAFALTGMSALALEVAWTRVLCMYLGSSVYSFAIVLTSFLLGLALGSYLYAVIFAKRPVTASHFAFVAAGIGISSLVLSVFYQYLPYTFLGLYTGFTFMQLAVLYALQFGVCLAMTLVPTSLMGMTFPIVAKLFADASGKLGEAVGKSYAANTAGSIVGSALGGLLFIPLLGLQWTVQGFSLVYIAVALAVIVIASRRPGDTARRWLAPAWGVFGFAVLAACLLPGWSRSALTSGVFRNNYKTADATVHGLSAIERPEDEVLFFEEGTCATVAILGGDYGLTLSVNGKPDASTYHGDMLTQQLTGHLPVLIEETPKRCLLIGLGSGCSAAAMCAHEDVENVEVAELEPIVAEASKHFREINRGILENPPAKLNMRFIDGRTALLSGRKYDVIISEPSNPWISGVSNLFTKEHYEACKQALTPTGTFCQWVQGYELDIDTIRMMVATVRTAFPMVEMWVSTGGDYLFIARPDGAPIDAERIRRRLEENEIVREDLAGIDHDSVGGLLGCRFFSPEDVARVAEGAPICTDDKPLLEFLAPKGLYAPSERNNFSWLADYSSGELPDTIGLPEDDESRVTLELEMARAWLGKDLPWQGRKHVWNALDLDPANAKAYEMLGECEWKLENTVRAIEALDRACVLAPRNAAPLILRARVALEAEVPGRAVEDLERAETLEPDDPEIAELLAEARAEAKEADDEDLWDQLLS